MQPQGGIHPQTHTLVLFTLVGEQNVRFENSFRNTACDKCKHYMPMRTYRIA